MLTNTRTKLADDLLSFVQVASTVSSETVLIDELMNRVKPYGVTHVAASLTTDSQRNFKFGRGFGRVNMAWAKTYFTEKLYMHDPVMAYAVKGQVSTFWGEALAAAGTEMTEGNRHVMERAAENDVRDGFLAIVPVIEGVVVVSLQGTELDHHPDVAAFLRGVAYYYGTEGFRIVSRLPSEAGAAAGLSQQEMRVMHLVALGQSAKMIGEQMGISHRTVEFHRDNARRKLKAANVAEAVALLHATPDNFFLPS